MYLTGILFVALAATMPLSSNKRENSNPLVVSEKREFTPDCPSVFDYCHNCHG